MFMYLTLALLVLATAVKSQDFYVGNALCSTTECGGGCVGGSVNYDFLTTDSDPGCDQFDSANIASNFAWPDSGLTFFQGILCGIELNFYAATVFGLSGFEFYIAGGDGTAQGLCYAAYGDLHYCLEGFGACTVQGIMDCDFYQGITPITC